MIDERHWWMVRKIGELVRTERGHFLLHESPATRCLVGAQLCMFDLVSLDQRLVMYWREPFDDVQGWFEWHWFETRWSEGFGYLRSPSIHQHVLDRIIRLVEMERVTVLLRMGVDPTRKFRPEPYRPPSVPFEQLKLRTCDARVYFARDRDSGEIKIGTSRSVRKRLVGVAYEKKHPVDPLATMSGDDDVEKIMHRRFASARIRGEWFRPVPELLAYIDSLKGAAA